MRALAIGATGMQAQQLNVEVISNNIANLSTNGFKASRAEFQDLLYQNMRSVGSASSDTGTILPSGLQVGLGVQPAATYRINGQGNLTVTGNPLDLAINGGGYYQIQLPDGTTAYTRDGGFQLNATGQIVNADGFLVLPNITVPATATAVTVNPSGQVLASISGQTNQQTLGQLQLASFINPAGLNAIGDNLLQETQASGTPITGNPQTNQYGSIVQGSLETSNVDVVSQITDLIAAQRAYEMNSRVINTADEMLQTANQMNAKMKNLSIAFFFSLILAATSLGLTGHAAAVALRSETDVNRPIVKLSDVFEGLPEGIDCDIARAPQPGKSITYDVNVLLHLVQQYKLDWQPQSPADHTVITTIGTKITADDIRSAIVQKVKDMNIKGDIDVLFDSHMLEMTLPSNQPSDLTVNNFSYDTINKRFHADLFVDGFNGPINLPIVGHVVIRHDVPVLAHRLEAGTVIGAADIDWLSVPEDRAAGAIANADQLIGRELQRDTDAGMPVRGRDIIAPRLVVRGALVTMKIETQFMTVTAQGRALQDGKRGDVVRVTNTQSNRVIEGVVEGSDIVRVLANQKIALASPEDRQE